MSKNPKNSGQVQEGPRACELDRRSNGRSGPERARAVEVSDAEALPCADLTCPCRVIKKNDDDLGTGCA